MTPQGSPQDRLNAGVGEAIRKVYPPDAACDERLDGLIERLKSMPVPDDRIDSMIGRLNGLPSTHNPSP